MGNVPAPVPRARRDRRPVRSARRQRADPGAVPGWRLRVQVVHEDGAAHGRTRAEGRAPRADPEPRRRVDGDDAPTQHDLPDAHRGDGGRSPPRPRCRVPVRHRCLRGQRPSRGRDRGRRSARPLPLGGIPRGRRMCLHEPRAGRLLPRLRSDAPPVDRRVAGRRGRPARRPRPARSPPREPLRPGRGGARRRQTARRRPRRRRREGGRRGRLGRGEGPVGRPRSVGRPARRRRAPGFERDLPPRSGRSRGRPGQHDRDGPGAADGIRADRRRGDRRRSRAGDGARRRHPLQPVRPLDRSEPVDDGRGPGGPAGGGGHPGTARSGSRALPRSGRTTTSASCAGTSGSRAAS